MLRSLNSDVSAQSWALISEYNNYHYYYTIIPFLTSPPVTNFHHSCVYEHLPVL